MEFDEVKNKIRREEMELTLSRLAEPFDESDIYWKPQAISKQTGKGIAAAFADPRVYSDRLSEILGADGWNCSYQLYTIPPLMPNPVAVVKPDEYKVKLSYRGKILVVATVSIDTLNQSHSGTGESWADDENAVTIAEAQGFKRASMRFGVGRYLYDLPNDMWCDYDGKTKKFTKTPPLPDWAKRKKKCEDCNNVISSFMHGDKELTVSWLITNGQTKYGKQLCAKCQQVRSKSNTGAITNG